MSDALSFAQIEGQHVEVLPARTVLSLFSVGGGGGGSTVVTSSCNNIAQPTSGGLAGLLPVEGFASQQCTPASVVNNH
ncbi:MAG: hypothetical protein WCB57_11750 [Pseudonocardiaceae bacterium]